MSPDGWWTRPWAGLPHWGWVLAAIIFVIETALGRNKDPRWRSVGDSLMSSIVLLLGLIPAARPVLVFLRAIHLLPVAVPVDPAPPAPPPPPDPSPK